MYDFEIKDGKLLYCDTDDTKIIIPKEVTVIEDYAFQWCSKLKEIEIPEGVLEIGKKAFFKCHSLEKVTLPESLISIGARAFEWCKTITEIILPNNITTIGSQAFYYCKSLKNLMLPEGITSIGQWAFGNCKSLTQITIPDGIIEADYSMFLGCESLEKIYMGVNSLNVVIKNDYSNFFKKFYPIIFRGWFAEDNVNCLNESELSTLNRYVQVFSTHHSVSTLDDPIFIAFAVGTRLLRLNIAHELLEICKNPESKAMLLTYINDNQKKENIYALLSL